MNPTSTKALGIIAFIGCVSSSLASDLEDQATLSLAHIEPYTAKFDYFLSDEEGSAELAGSWTDSLVISDGRVIRAVERFNLDDQRDLTRTVVAEQDTLAPVRI